MGMCISNQSAVEVQNGPVTYSKPYAGQPPLTKKTKITQYPGNRRPLNEPYVPAVSEFAYNATNGQSGVTKHFVNYGGGNALTLVDGPPPSNETTSSGKQYIQGEAIVLYVISKCIDINLFEFFCKFDVTSDFAPRVIPWRRASCQKPGWPNDCYSSTRGNVRRRTIHC